METESVESTSTSTKMGEFSITDELYEISEATNNDGTVNVSIYDFKKVNDGDSVQVHFHTPTMAKQHETMDWPRKDDTKYKFVRICRKTVGSLSGAKFLKTDGAEIAADPDEWEIDAKLTLKQKITGQIRNLSAKEIAKRGVVMLMVALTVTSGLTFLLGPVYALLTLVGAVPAIPHFVVMWVISFVVSIFMLELMEENN